MAIDDPAGKTEVVRKRQMSKTNNGANLGSENQLWAVADTYGVSKDLVTWRTNVTGVKL